MSRRLEVELTSRRDDGSWTWRAAGAKQPKGVLDGELLPPGVGEGDVLRVDADFEVDGIFVTQVLPPKARSGKPPAERIELIGPPDRAAGTTTTRVGGRGGRKRDGDRAKRRPGERGERNRRRERGGGDRSRGRATAAERDGAKRRQRRDRDRRPDGNAQQDAPTDDNGKPKTETPERPPKPKARKLRPGRKHRDALIASLPAEQQVVAEQVARGGLAAVRAEIEAQNRTAAEEGTPEVPAEGVLALAESLVGQMQIAEWRDRADAALAGIERTDLRDLRSVLVAAEDYARDAEARELAEQIREGLNERVERSQREWHDELRTTLTEGRVVRALRLSSRPPKAGAPLPPEIAQELTSQANAALGTGASQHRIAVVLEAVAFSPVRPYVVLSNIPSEPTEELVEAVQKVASRLPEVAAALGIDPAEARPRSQPRRQRGRRPKAEPAEAAAPVSNPETAGEADASGDAVNETGGEQPGAAEAGTEASAAEDVAVEELAHPA
ncbi:hypothetical protein [Candidatus Poriferisodalis sp.]|uniref:hypothetical protein n=1 Tax=Candidatus Poriferisodalis sp. TaxID=3101277 RepID=UPI003B02B233